IRDSIQDFSDLETELTENGSRQNKLFEEFEGYRERIDSLLGDANRTGMAASFKQHKDALLAPLILWMLIFSLSIVGLVILGVYQILPLFEQADDNQLTDL